MKNNLLKFIVLSLVIGSVASCSKDDDKGDAGKVDYKYKLASIVWKLDEASGDGVDSIKVAATERIYSNNGSLEYPIVIKVNDDISETSYFRCDNEEDIELLNEWAGEDVFVPIPTEPGIMGSSWTYHLSNIKAPLQVSQSIAIEPTKTYSYGFAVKPNIKVTYNNTILMKRINATFKAQFVAEENESEKFSVEGKWTGTFIETSNPKIVFDNLK